MKSLGLFAVALLLITAGVVIYFLMRTSKGEMCQKIKMKLEDKLFYNAFLRYMTVSNLKLNFTLWGFLIYHYTSGHWMMLVFGTILGLVILYPGLLMYGLIKNHHRVEEVKFNRQFNSVLKGIKIHSKEALLYDSVFCIRRFYIVFINLTMSPDMPLTDFE